MLPTDISNISLHSKIQDENLRLAIKLTIILILITSIYELTKLSRKPYNNAKFTGARYTQFLLNGNPRRSRAMLCVNPGTFKFLAKKLADVN